MDEIKIRKRRLSHGWYPEKPDFIKKFIKKIENEIKTEEKFTNKIAAIVPHAGWSFSGSLAVKCLSNLYTNPETIIIVGGHLPSVSPLLYSPEDVFETVLGNFKADKEFLSKLKLIFKMEKDFSNDNSVEVLLPIIKYFYQNSNLVWLRVGSGTDSIKLGSSIYNISKILNRKIIVLGSTDLTHYGPDFSFTPKGIGLNSINWVKNINDKNIINNMIKMNCIDVLKSAKINQSACSAGAAAAAIKFASLSGVKNGKLIGYDNSYDISPSDSFVGYAGIIF